MPHEVTRPATYGPSSPPVGPASFPLLFAPGRGAFCLGCHPPSGYPYNMHAVVLSLSEHTLVELEQTYLSIDVQLRRWQDRSVHDFLDRKRPIIIATQASQALNSAAVLGAVKGPQCGGAAGACNRRNISWHAVDSAHCQPRERNGFDTIGIEPGFARTGDTQVR